MTVRQLGIGVAVAVLLDAFLVRPVLLPAAVAVLGRRSWWPLSRTAPGPPSAEPPPAPSDARFQTLTPAGGPRP
jgi:putative drug exporter of the RND superfamily